MRRIESFSPQKSIRAVESYQAFAIVVNICTFDPLFHKIHHPENQMANDNPDRSHDCMQALEVGISIITIYNYYCCDKFRCINISVKRFAFLLGLASRGEMLSYTGTAVPARGISPSILEGVPAGGVVI